MKPTRSLRRRVAASPHPELSEAVSVTRFWRLVDVRATDECWPWLGEYDRDYGVFHYRGKMRRAPELALSFTYGEKRLESLDTCHECDNPSCVNPDHLRFDTRQSNVDDMMRRGRGNHGRKLDAERVRLIRERRAAGARQKDLAQQFGITDGEVSMIVRGLRWANAGGPIERKHCRGE